MELKFKMLQQIKKEEYLAKFNERKQILQEQFLARRCKRLMVGNTSNFSHQSPQKKAKYFLCNDKDDNNNNVSDICYPWVYMCI